MQDLHEENNKALLKDIKEDPNKWKINHVPLDRMIQTLN